VPRRETIELNTHLLAERIAALDMKQWVIATRLGVARRSLSRWLSGEVKKISRGNLDKLAALLGCPPEDISVDDSSPPFATRADQSQAARNIVKEPAESIFNTTENYELYESLIKATLHPDLTHRQLAVLYSRLQVTSAKQRKFEEAERYGNLSIDYARKAGDKGHEAAGFMNTALVEAERGQLEQARLALLEAHRIAGELGSHKHQINIAGNLCDIYRLQGELDKAAEQREIFVETLSKSRDMPVRAGSLMSAGQLSLELGEIEKAQHYFDECSRVPANPPLIRLSAEARLWYSYALCLRGEREAALQLASEQRETLERFSYFEFSWQLGLARILRLCGRLAEAEAAVQQGLGAPFTRTYELPFLLEEQALIAEARGDLAAAGQLRRKAIKGFKACGMPLRAARV
jgi:tetratricopeptide (TPR) repeat protein